MDMYELETWAQETLAGVPLSGPSEPDDVSIVGDDCVDILYNERMYRIRVVVMEA